MHLSKTLKFLSNRIQMYFDEGRNIYLSSSFQTQSVPLLHIAATHFPDVKVLFIDTGRLFPETYQFKRKLEKDFKLNIITLKSAEAKTQIKSASGKYMYEEDPDQCCFINKVKPMEEAIQAGDVWISGVRRDQTTVRSQMKEVEIDNRAVIRLHPMLDWTAGDVSAYMQKYQLPAHPLDEAGYTSIGCVPCTVNPQTGESMRAGRWVGKNKTECGLHTHSRKK